MTAVSEVFLLLFLQKKKWFLPYLFPNSANPATGSVARRM